MPGLNLRRRVEVPETTLYIAEPTARSMGLSAADVVEPENRQRYVLLNGKKPIMDLRALQEEMRNKPGNRPIVSVGPDGRTPTLLLHDGEMEAEEAQDLLGETYERNEATLRRQQAGTANVNPGNATPVVDTAWIRHVNGMPQAEDFDHLFREALTERIAKHKASPVTDPERDPWEYAKENDLLPIKSFPDGPAKASPE